MIAVSVHRVLSDSPAARWTALLIAAFTMMTGYFLYDVMAPLETMLENDLGWTSGEYGFFSGSYAFINVYLLMLFIGGMFLDKFGIRLTGVLAASLMVIGAFIKYYAVSSVSPAITAAVRLPLFGLGGEVKVQVLLASLGFSLFGVGSEVTGFTVSKIMVKWFTGHELALAMGIQVATARLGTAAALAVSRPFAAHFGSPSASILLGALLLTAGLLFFLVYCVMDRRLDRSLVAKGYDKGDVFHARDLSLILKDAGFWHITLICLFFYSAVNPFLKFAARMMETKYGVDADMAGTVVALVPFGAIPLTPLFGGLYDRIGHGVTLIITGAALITAIHILFALPFTFGSWFPVVSMILLSVAFSLLPSALWPSVPRIIPQSRLGTAYASVFWLQNAGRAMIPILIGSVLEGAAARASSPSFTRASLIFAFFAAAAVAAAVSLRRLDARRHYGLERPSAPSRR